MEPAPTISVVSLFLNADIVVKGVLVPLLLASVWSWAVIIDKLWRLGAISHAAREHEARAAAAGTAEELWARPRMAQDPAAQVLAAGLQESAVDASPDVETMAERRDRVERAMRLALNSEMRRLEARLPFLATLGSAAPFIGLFGTVWGIMRSFGGIAAANNTSIAVVAPGIAEALFATVMGLAAAIPAVVAYNKITVELGRFAGRMQGLIGRSRRPSGTRRGRLIMAVRLPPSGEVDEDRYQPLAEINVTPMVDVMLVLLVIFMVTAPLLTVGVPLDLPKTTAAELQQPKEPIVLSLDREGGTFLGNEPVAAADLKDRLAQLAAEDPERIVYVRGDRAISYAQLMDALGLVNMAGFTKVSLLAEGAKPQ